MKVFNWGFFRSSLEVWWMVSSLLSVISKIKYKTFPIIVLLIPQHFRHLPAHSSLCSQTPWSRAVSTFSVVRAFPCALLSQVQPFTLPPELWNASNSAKVPPLMNMFFPAEWGINIFLIITKSIPTLCGKNRGVYQLTGNYDKTVESKAKERNIKFPFLRRWEQFWEFRTTLLLPLIFSSVDISHSGLWRILWGRSCVSKGVDPAALGRWITDSHVDGSFFIWRFKNSSMLILCFLK